MERIYILKPKDSSVVISEDTSHIQTMNLVYKLKTQKSNGQVWVKELKNILNNTA